MKLKGLLAAGLNLALWLSAPLSAKGPEQYLDIKDFHCGIDSYHSSLTIGDCFVQDALNVYFDKVSGVQKRGGYTTAFSSAGYSYSGLWSYTDSSANIWLIARSSNTIMATTGIGTSTFNVKVATISVNDSVNCVTAQGNFYCVDQTQGVYYWNGSVLKAVASSPHGSLIANFHGRVWVSGLAVPNGNFLYGSAYLDGTTWTTGVNATDPVALQVNLLDNADVVTTLFAGYNDVLYVLRNYGIYGLTGFDQTTFQISQLNTEVGCIDQRGIQPIFGGLVFPSARGIEFFDGYTATRISDPIKNLVDPITLGSSFSQTSWVQSSQADWEAGTITPTGSLSTTISPGAIVLSTASGSFSDQANSDFSSGTLSNVTVANNSVYISTNNSGAINDPSFEATYATNYSGTMNFNTCDSVCGSGGQSGTQFAETLNDGNCGGTCGGSCSNSSPNMSAFSFVLLDASGVGISTNTLSVSPGCGWTLYTLADASSAGRRVKYKWFNTAAIGASQMTTKASYIFPGTVSFYYRCPDQSGLSRWCDVDNVQGGSSTITSGVFTSRVFDTGVSSSILKSQMVSISTVSNTEPITTVLQTSSNGTTWVDATTSTGTPTTTNRYLRYISTFTIGPGDTALSTLNGVSLSYNFTQSSGAFKSQIHNVGAINSWGNFSASSILNNGTIAYSICSSTSSDMSGPKSCAVQPENSQISISTATYVQYYATFTVTSDTQAPTLNDTTVGWFLGTRKPPMASMVYDNRYWLSITTNTSDSTNDATFVLSKGPLWSLFDIKAGAFTLWKNQPYFADANATGRTYQLEQGLNDAGSAINAFIRTKDFAPGGLIDDKYWDSIFVIADNRGAYTIDTSYYVDRVSTPFTLGTILQNETPGTLISRLNLPIDSTHQNFSKTISFKFSNATVDAPFLIYGGSLRYHVRPAQ